MGKQHSGAHGSLGDGRKAFPPASKVGKV